MISGLGRIFLNRSHAEKYQLQQEYLISICELEIDHIMFVETRAS